MYPIQVGNYNFKRIYLWLQYSEILPAFSEIVIEVFYPNNMKANGLMMFNHGFLIGNDFLFIPKTILSKVTNQDTPLFEVNPSWYYNYSGAAIENNWALAFVTTCHQQMNAMPWTDIGGNPRVGQAAYAAASYLVRYGATHKYKDKEAVRQSRFLSTEACDGNSMGNRVIFAGHSVGGAHAQAAASGFDNLQKIGGKNYMPYDPIFYNRELVPDHTLRLSEWDSSMRANPVGLLQLSPVDGAGGQLIPFLAPGMKPYREALAGIQMPNLMVTGDLDTACLSAKNSTPPAWIDETDHAKSQYAQQAYGSADSWAAICMVDKGSHCGYLRHVNDACSMADKADGAYTAGQAEYRFTDELVNQYIRFIESLDNGNCSFDEWKHGSLINWLNNANPGTSGVSMKGFSDGYVHFSH